MPNAPKKPKLTDTQLALLSAAAQRPDGAVLPPPPSLTLNKLALWKVLNSLLKTDFIAERPAKLEEVVWRTEDEQRFTLVITETGLLAIGIEADVDVINTSSRHHFNTSLPSPKPTPKHSTLIDLMKRPNGATVQELMTATGWQAHSVRGAISGTLKKKLGLRVNSDRVTERGRVYRIVRDGNMQ